MVDVGDILPLGRCVDDLEVDRRNVLAVLAFETYFDTDAAFTVGVICPRQEDQASDYSDNDGQKYNQSSQRATFRKGGISRTMIVGGKWWYRQG